MSTSDFQSIKIIGKGAFGEVRICRNLKNNEVVAIKKIKKHDMIVKNQIAHINAERDILAFANKDWIVEFKCSF